MPIPKIAERAKTLWTHLRIHVIGGGLTLLVLAALAGIVYNIVQVQRELNQPPPLIYESVPHPIKASVCPGDAFVYDFHLSIAEVPTVLQVARSVWSYEVGSTVVAADDVNSYVWVAFADISRSSSYTLPLQTDSGKSFAPGRYSLNVGAFAEGKGTAAFNVDFVVPVGCEA